MHAARGKNRRLGSILTGPTGGDKPRVRPAATAEQGNHRRALGSSTCTFEHAARTGNGRWIPKKSHLVHFSSPVSLFCARFDSTRYSGSDESDAAFDDERNRVSRHRSKPVHPRCATLDVVGDTTLFSKWRNDYH